MLVHCIMGCSHGQPLAMCVMIGSNRGHSALDLCAVMALTLPRPLGARPWLKAMLSQHHAVQVVLLICMPCTRPCQAVCADAGLSREWWLLHVVVLRLDCLWCFSARCFGGNHILPECIVYWFASCRHDSRNQLPCTCVGLPCTIVLTDVS